MYGHFRHDEFCHVFQNNEAFLFYQNVFSSTYDLKHILILHFIRILFVIYLIVENLQKNLKLQYNIYLTASMK